MSLVAGGGAVCPIEPVRMYSVRGAATEPMAVAGIIVRGRVGSGSAEERSDDAERVNPAADPPRFKPKRGHGLLSDSDLHEAGLLARQVGEPGTETRLHPSQLKQGCPRRGFHDEALVFAVETDFVVADRCGDIGLDVQGLDH